MYSLIFPALGVFVLILSKSSSFSGSNGNSFLSISIYRCFIFRVPPFNPISKYKDTPIIGKTRIKIIHGIFIDEVLSEEYKNKTRIPANNLVIRLIISAYSFNLVIITMIKAASSNMQNPEKHNLLTPFFVIALLSKVSCFI